METFHSRVKGVLPETGKPVVAGVQLPEGQRIVPDPSMASGKPSSAPVLWASLKPPRELPALWKKLASAFDKTGLWPLELESLRGDDDRPWISAELDPSASSRPDRHEALQVLSSWWKDVVPAKGEDEALAALAPFGRTFPGLAKASTSSHPKAVESVIAKAKGRLGLVAVERPADALVALGWTGPVNHYADMGLLSAVLRSWEERFGAILVGVGFDTLSVAVQKPPKTAEAALGIAAEHFAACSDSIYQGAGSMEAYAEQLVGEPLWSFWWD